MRKLAFVAAIAIVVMIIPLFTPMTSAAGQPPIVTNTLWVGEDSYSFIGIHAPRLGPTSAWGPVDADPAVARDCQSKEIILNVYEGLLGFNGELYYQFKPLLATNVPTRQDITTIITITSAVGADPTGSTWSDGLTCLGWVDESADGFNVGDAIYLGQIGVPGTYHTWAVVSMIGSSPTITLGLWRGSYVFNLRTANTVPFFDHTGVIYDYFNATDAEYSFERALILNSAGTPIWMLSKALFDVCDYTSFTGDTAINLAHLVDDAIVGDPVANTLTINVGIRFPDNSFKQILCEPCCSIVDKEYVVANGLGWDGNLYNTTEYGGHYPDWWIDWSNQGNGIDYATRDPLDAMIPTSFCGTGPYYVDTVDQVDQEVILKRNPAYWRGWPNQGPPVSGGYVDTVIIEYIEDWSTRKTDFLAGSIDVCAVPTASMFDLLDNVTKQPVTPGIKTITNIIPVFDVDTVQFTFNTNNASTYIGTGSFPNGIPLDFFNNTHTRKAFAYSFNWSAYLQQECYCEADYRSNWCVPGLYPDYYNSSVPSYYESLANAEAQLKTATVGGQNVWDSGFTLTMTFKAGINMAGYACNMISAFFQTLSTFDGRSGPPFVVNVQEIDSPTLIRSMEQEKLPIFIYGWPANFADVDDFARTYMHSKGELAFFEGYTADNGWGSLKDLLVDQAALTPDGAARQALYQQLQLICYNDCPSIPLPTVRGRMWTWYWVKGWYHNALCPGLYFYPLWKSDDPWYDVSGSTPGISDGVVAMRDIAYLIAHFNAKAPVPGLPIDPKWVAVYGANGCVDPFGDRVCNMKDIAGAIQNFNAKGGTGHP
jgi:peptide/nickel transport system substrate-binding protein